MARYSDTVVDQFGNAVSGVQISVYPRATPSVLATLTDDAGAALGNPVASDSDGLFSFNAATGDYTLSFKLASATRPFHVETVNLNDAIRADLSLSTGSSLIGFIQEGTGAVARTLQAKSRDVLCAKDFGVVGDGSTSDSVAAQRAIDAAIALGGADLIFPAGTYKASGLSISGYTGRGLRLIGHGAEIRLAATQTGLSITNSQNVTVEGFRFKSAVTLNIASLDLTLIGVLVTNSSRITLNCAYENLTYGEQWFSTMVTTVLGRAIPMPSRTSPLAKGCVTGVYFAPAAQYIECHSANVTECLIYGLISEGGNNKVVGGNYLSNAVGVYFDGAASGNGDHGAIVGASINHNINCNVWLHSLDYSMVVTGCNIWACIDGQAIPGDPTFAVPIGLLMTGCKNTVVVGNAIARNGVNLAHNGPTYSRIAYNSFQADSANTTYNIKGSVALPSTSQITGNTFEGALVAAADDNDPEKWITPTLVNGWADFGGPYGGAKYRVLGNRVLELSGLIKNGSAVPSIAFTLPAGARPAFSRRTATASNAAYGDIEVDTAGNVSVKTGSATWVSLDNIRIPLD
jgi:hypothetical protein